MARAACWWTSTGRGMDTAISRGKAVQFLVIGSGKCWLAMALFVLMAIPVLPCRADDLQSDPAPAEVRSSVDQERLRALIATIQTEEARYQNYVATWRRSFVTTPTQQTVFESTTRQHVQGPLFNVRSEDVITMDVDDTRSGWRESVFDGKITVATEGNNSTSEYAGRSEPVYLLPPSVWGLFAQDVCFPLSVLLGGTDALRSFPKTNWYASDRPVPFAIRAAEVTSIADEPVDGLECVKVRIKSWSLGVEKPSSMDLWLAKDRNWHVVHCKIISIEGARAITINETSAKKWSKAAPDLWFPRLFESSLVQPNGDLTTYMRLVVESLELNPAITPGTFRANIPSKDLPKFVVNERNQLTDSPHHPVQMKSTQSYSLDEILERLAVEEQKYKSFDLELVKRRSSLNARESSLAGEIYESQERYMTRGEQRYMETITSELFSKSAKASDQQLVRSEFQFNQQSDDGTVLRTVRSFRSRRDGSVDTFVGLDFPRDGYRLPLRLPHSFLFEEAGMLESLARFLQSGWYDEPAGARMEVVYEGDEQIDNLICHKLKCNLPKLLPTTPKSHFVVWLARDRNLLPIRREEYHEKDHGTLPVAVAFTSEISEVQPGCWFPVRSSILQLQRADRNSLVVNRVVLCGRIDWEVKQITLDPVVDVDFCADLQIRQGTQVNVIEKNRTQWVYTQKADGRIEVSTDPTIRTTQQVDADRSPQKPSTR